MAAHPHYTSNTFAGHAHARISKGWAHMREKSHANQSIKNVLVLSIFEKTSSEYLQYVPLHPSNKHQTQQILNIKIQKMGFVTTMQVHIYSRGYQMPRKHH